MAKIPTKTDAPEFVPRTYGADESRGIRRIMGFNPGAERVVAPRSQPLPGASERPHVDIALAERASESFSPEGKLLNAISNAISRLNAVDQVDLTDDGAEHTRELNDLNSLQTTIENVDLEKLIEMADKGVIDMNEALSVALYALENTNAIAEESIFEIGQLRRLIDQNSREIDRIQHNTRVALEGLPHAG